MSDVLYLLRLEIVFQHLDSLRRDLKQLKRRPTPQYTQYLFYGWNLELERWERILRSDWLPERVRPFPALVQQEKGLFLAI